MLLLVLLGAGVILLVISIGMYFDGWQWMEEALKRTGDFQRFLPWLGNGSGRAVIPGLGSPASTSPEAARASERIRTALSLGMAAFLLIAVWALLSRQFPAWDQSMSGASFSSVLAMLALAGALASFLAGAVYAARAGAGALSIVWPLAIGRIRRAGGEPARQVNKALVAFIACLLVGAAAFSASTNLHRFAK
jgi:hypothetical protein